MVLSTFWACRERLKRDDSAPAVVATGDLADACVGDSLRPAAGAPAPGLWLYERASSRERVAAMIGAPRPDDGKLTVTRPVETVEVLAAGDTIRHRVGAATPVLELLPPARAATLGATGIPDGGVGMQPAATYALSPRVRLAAYEPCATSVRAPRIRYLRRDEAGRIITDVMLQRASAQ